MSDYFQCLLQAPRHLLTIASRVLQQRALSQKCHNRFRQRGAKVHKSIVKALPRTKTRDFLFSPECHAHHRLIALIIYILINRGGWVF